MALPNFGLLSDFLLDPPTMINYHSLAPSLLYLNLAPQWPDFRVHLTGFSFHLQKIMKNQIKVCASCLGYEISKRPYPLHRVDNACFYFVKPGK